MPYKTIRDLPANIRKRLKQFQQEIFLKVFNKTLLKYGDEGTAFRFAWKAVDNTGFIRTEQVNKPVYYY